MHARIENNRVERKAALIHRLRENEPGLSTLDDEAVLHIYNTSVSIHQSNKNKNGRFLESTVADLLRDNDIPYKEQVAINKHGIIVSGTIRHTEVDHVIDVVVGDDIVNGKSITEFIAISCKTTCRERWKLDTAWTHVFPPTLFILLVMSDDYPVRSINKEDPKNFGESERRKIVTCHPKANDNRDFKLGFSDIIPLLRSNLE
jgi:hypothetical protein